MNSGKSWRCNCGALVWGIKLWTERIHISKYQCHCGFGGGWGAVRRRRILIWLALLISLCLQSFPPSLQSGGKRGRRLQQTITFAFWGDESHSSPSHREVTYGHRRSIFILHHLVMSYRPLQREEASRFSPASATCGLHSLGNVFTGPEPEAPPRWNGDNKYAWTIGLLSELPKRTLSLEGKLRPTWTAYWKAETLLCQQRSV